MRFVVVNSDGSIEKTCSAAKAHVLHQLQAGQSAWELHSDFTETYADDTKLRLVNGTFVLLDGIAGPVYGENYAPTFIATKS